MLVYREAALQFLLMAVAPSRCSEVSKAADSATPQASTALLPQQPPGPLHNLLTHLSQPTTTPPSAGPDPSPSGPAPVTSNLSLRQHVLQQVQSQHFALQRLIKICAELALGPAGNQATPTVRLAATDPIPAEGVGQWVLLGQLLNILDDYTHMLAFSLEDMVPGHRHRRAPRMVQSTLLYLTAVAEATGKAQR